MTDINQKKSDILAEILARAYPGFEYTLSWTSGDFRIQLSWENGFTEAQVASLIKENAPDITLTYIRRYSKKVINKCAMTFPGDPWREILPFVDLTQPWDADAIRLKVLRQDTTEVAGTEKKRILVKFFCQEEVDFFLNRLARSWEPSSPKYTASQIQKEPGTGKEYTFPVVLVDIDPKITT